MMAAVLKPFQTAMRRFSADDRVSPTDDLTPHTFDSLAKAGYIEKLPNAKKPAKD
jgi:hypothetical protein